MNARIAQQPGRFDEVAFIMAYEGGELDNEGIIEGFQHMIDTGLCWRLQGCYGRMAESLIQAGYCHRHPEG